MAEIPDILGFVEGYRFDPDHLSDVLIERHARGDLVMASQQVGLPGAWERAKASGMTGVFLRDCEIPLLGKHRRPYLQRRGSCVSRGLTRGAQASLDYSIVKTASLLQSVTLEFASVYSMARVEIGKNRCGWQDGAQLCDAATVIHDLGIATMDLFAGMTEDQIEMLAVKYAAPNAGTPAAWKAACAGHTASTFSPDTLALVMDCIASGYAVPYASGWLTGIPNAEGLSRLGSAGAHCRMWSGVYTDSHGVDQLVTQESWGRYPNGQTQNIDQTMDVDEIPCATIQTVNGPKILAPGEVGCDSKQWWDCVQNSGEAWAVGAPSFMGDEIADITVNATSA